MPKYHARLRMVDPGHPRPTTCWHTDVPVEPYERLSDAEIERRAVKAAVRAFGRDARSWKLIDAERRR